MKQSPLFATLSVSVSLVLFSTGANATVFLLAATIDGAQANAGMGTGSSGVGSMTGSYDNILSIFAWNVQWSGLSGPATVAHFHGPALPNQNAGVQVPISNLSPAVGSTTITAPQAADLLNELWYVNIHSATFPAGEIRGQVQVVPEPSHALLSLIGLMGIALRRQR